MRKAGTMEDLVQGQHGSIKNGLETPFVAPNWLSQHSCKGGEAQINSQLLLHPYYFEFQPPIFFGNRPNVGFPWISPIFCWCFTMIQPPQGLVLLLMGSLVGLPNRLGLRLLCLLLALGASRWETHPCFLKGEMLIYIMDMIGNY